MTLAPLYVPSSAGEQFGHVLRTRRAGRFLLRESRYSGSLRMPEHYHSRAYFTFVVAGGVREHDRRAEREYQAGSVHFHPAGDPHSGEIAAGGTICLSIVPADELVDPAATGSIACLDHPAGTHASRLARRCHDQLGAADSASDLSLEALGIELLATLLRTRVARERRTPRWLLEVRDYLHAHCLESVRLEELSALADIHEVHLVRAFHRRFGATPGAYLRGLRVEHARRALIDSDAPIADLALEAGFSSQAHFTRVFHQLEGTTPATYRRGRRRATGRSSLRG